MLDCAENPRRAKDEVVIDVRAGKGLAARRGVARRQRVAVLVPCFNEEAAIAKVVGDFRAALPEATIYVYDNNSTDRTDRGRPRRRRGGAPRAPPGQG